MIRHTARDVPPHVHLVDAAHHLRNARRSLEAAGDRAPAELGLAVLVAERRARRLGRAKCPLGGQRETAAGAAASMPGMSKTERGAR